jgi:endonuclease G
MNLHALFPAALLFTGASAAVAQHLPRGESPPVVCSGFYFGGQAPASSPTVPVGRIFCHMIYSVSYSTQRLNPLWSAQHLTRAMSQAGDAISRIDQSTFRRQEELNRRAQARDAEFAHNVWDKGHMTPANDAPDEEAQEDTFFLTNAVPQHEKLNRFLWQYLEGSVHQLAQREGEVFIVTGPLFEGPPQPPMGRVPVPSHTYKAVYIPSRNLAIGFIATNEATPVCTVVSVDEITRRTGIDPFPAVSAVIKSQVPALTLPNGINPRRDGTRQILPLPDCRPVGP